MKHAFYMFTFMFLQSVADDEATNSKVPLPNLSQTLLAIANIFDSQAASPDDTSALESRPAPKSVGMNEDVVSQDARVLLDQFDQNIAVLFRQVHKSHACDHVVPVNTHGTYQRAGFRVTEDMGGAHYQVDEQVHSFTFR